MAQAKGPIGVFDSGFGGLSILKEIERMLPQYRYLYLGDTARTPYGTRSAEVVYAFTVQAIDFLFAQGCELIIIACNTASAEALRKIQREYLPLRYPNKRVLGVIVPALEEAAARTINGRIGVIATEGTVRSETFPRELKKRNPKLRIFQQACPLLVPFVEAGETRSKTVKLTLEGYLQPLLKKRIDTLILGCTHYGHLEPMIRRIVGSRMHLVSEGKIVARQLKEYIQRHPEINARLAKTAGTIFYTTDLTDRFQKTGSVFFGRKIRPQRVDLLDPRR